MSQYILIDRFYNIDDKRTSDDRPIPSSAWPLEHSGGVREPSPFDVHIPRVCQFNDFSNNLL